MLGIEKEAVIFLYAILTGITMFLCYQLLILWRSVVRHGNISINLEDLFYWAGTGIYIYYQMYQTTYGSIRGFFLLGIVVGNLTAYFVKKNVKKLFEKWKKVLEKRKENR